MKLAIFPFDKEGLNDVIFQAHPMFNAIKEKYEKRGFQVHTIDLFDTWEDIDYFFLFSLEWVIVGKMQKYRGIKVYFAFEPEVVIRWHEKTRIKMLAAFFDYIFTPFDDVVDGKTIYKIDEVKRLDLDIGKVKFQNRQLLCNISGYKSSMNHKELYSERIKVIKWFEQNSGIEFRFFGHGNWKKLKNRNYGGEPTNKEEIYHNYKFALALENSKEINGYISEKIIDCLRLGIVPIYAGGSNITKYIPANCYIDYFSFDCVGDIVKFICEMDEDTYNLYLDAARVFMESDEPNRYSTQTFLQTLENVLMAELTYKNLEKKKSLIIKAYFYFIQDKCLNLLNRYRVMLKQRRDVVSNRTTDFRIQK